MRYVLTHLGESLLAVRADQVLEVLELPWLSSWPGSPPDVVGVVDYRGVPAPVIDPSRRLGGPASFCSVRSQVLFFQSPQGPAGLLVEGADDLVEVEASAHHSIESVPHPQLWAAAAPFLTCLLALGDQIAMVLDPARLVNFELPSAGGTSPPAGLGEMNAIDRAILARRARALAQAEGESRSHGQVDLVVVRLGEERFALDVGRVAELISASPITPLPGGPPHLLGLMYHRGRLLRLVDIRPQLGLPVSDEALAEVVVLNVPGMPTGLGVDAIETVVTLDPTQFQPHSSGEAGVLSLGSLAYGGSWLTRLDFERLQVAEQ